MCQWNHDTQCQLLKQMIPRERTLDHDIIVCLNNGILGCMHVCVQELNTSETACATAENGRHTITLAMYSSSCTGNAPSLVVFKLPLNKHLCQRVLKL